MPITFCHWTHLGPAGHTSDGPFFKGVSTHFYTKALHDQSHSIYILYDL